MIGRFALLTALAPCLALTSGCLSKAELPPTRYFSPGPLLSKDAAPEEPAERLPLRLRDVSAADHLRERMVWTTDPEFGFYEEARWTEPPASYVERLLGQALFERGPFRRASGGDAPVLDVRLLEFEEVVGPEGRRAQVALHLLLFSGDGQARLERTVASSEPVSSDDPAAVAKATGVALRGAIDAARRQVVSAAR